MNKKLIFTSLALVTLFILGISTVSAYFENTQYEGSFQPSYRTQSGGSFRPTYSYNSYYPSSYNSNKVYTSNYRNYYDSPTFSFLSNPRGYSGPSYSNYYNSYSNPTYRYNSPFQYSSQYGYLKNNQYADYNQKGFSSGQNSYSLNRQPCQTYTRHLDFNGKRNDVRFTEKICDGTTIRDSNSNSYGNSYNNNYGYNLRDFSNSQYYLY
jgi:hypothetical protein